MRQQYEGESLGPIILEIEKRQEKLKEIRPRVAKQDRKSLDLRLQALEKSRQILTRACKSSPPVRMKKGGCAVLESVTCALASTSLSARQRTYSLFVESLQQKDSPSSAEGQIQGAGVCEASA